ncbi:MAG: hypothetical protein AAF798_17505 [Bacteroidota bacterium]
MLKPTRNNLKKLEGLFEELSYTVRYEKGSFQSGYCLVENRKIAIINKFYDTEGRINCLLDILSTVEVDVAVLGVKNQKLFKQLFKPKPSKAQEEEE